MAHIEKTKYGTYRVRYRTAENRARSLTLKRKQDALKFAASVETDKNRGEYIDPADRRIAFKELADEWWRSTTKLAPTTRHGYEQLLRLHVLPYFGNRRQGDIDYLLVEHFINDKLEAGFSGKRVADMVSVVSLIMKLAVLGGMRRDNPAAGHNVPRRHRRVRTSEMLTMTQVNELVEATRDPYKPAVWLLVFAGLRPSELCGLRVRAVDFMRSTVSVLETLTPVNQDSDGPYRLVEGPPKTDAGERTIPVPQWLTDDLAAMLADRGERSGPLDWLFESIQGGKALNRNDLRRRIIVPALKAAGLDPSFRTYDLRHVHASLLIDAGANVLDIAHRMGHTDPTVTLKVYGHMINNRQGELTNELDKLAQKARRQGREVIRLDDRRSAGDE